MKLDYLLINKENEHNINIEIFSFHLFDFESPCKQRGFHEFYEAI